MIKKVCFWNVVKTGSLHGRLGSCPESDHGNDITLKRLMQRGYESMLDYYERVSLQLNEPLYTRPVRTVV